MQEYFGYDYFRRALEERLGEIQFDIVRTENVLKDYKQEYSETEEALRELEVSKDKFIGLDDDYSS